MGGGGGGGSIDHTLLETTQPSHQVRPVLGSRIFSGLIVLTSWKDLTVNAIGMHID